MLLLSVFCSLFSPIDASEATLFRSYDRPLPPQTYTHSFRISGTLHGKHVSFDVFGTYHPFPVDQYHPNVKKFLLNHQYLAVKNLNVFKKDVIPGKNISGQVFALKHQIHFSKGLI